MKSFVFTSYEGQTLGPNEENLQNIQVLGFAKGYNAKNAFNNLLKENKWLIKTSFQETIAMELKHINYLAKAQSFLIPS